MAIIRLTKDNFQTLKLLANPERTFTSSSAGITGSVLLFADTSSGIKDLEPTFGEGEVTPGPVDSVNQIDEWRNALVVATADEQHLIDPNNAAGGSNIYDSLGGEPTFRGTRPAPNDYLGLVNSASVPLRNSKRQEVLRFTPGTTFDENFLRKMTVKKTLFPYYRNLYPSAQWAYTNYNCLNFVTGGNLPTSSVLIYPAGTGTLANENSNPFAPANAFTFDFYINPKYTTGRVGDEYGAGTVLHMSSCYAVSLVSGSSIGLDGKPDGFRLLLQLSASANIPPSKCAISGDSVTTPLSGEDGRFLFVSSDNSLKKNTWHHASIRWGGPSVNRATGSIVIDEVIDQLFVVNSSSIMQASSSTANLLDPDALFVGNFYEGPNAGASAIALFFNPVASLAEGLMEFSSTLPGDDPAVYTFAHPLNAEVHDLKIFNEYKVGNDLEAMAVAGSSLTSDLLFYVPPFFTKDSRNRLILQTPFFDATGSSEDPFNVALSFGVGGLSINLENFTREFVTSQFPRLWDLTASRIDVPQWTPQTANYLLYKSGSSIKRNLTITPCDNGRFFPNFDLLKTAPPQGVANATSGSVFTSRYVGSFDNRFVDSFGYSDFSLISLEDMVPSGSVLTGTMVSRADVVETEEGEMAAGGGNLLLSIEGATPEDPGVAPSSILTVAQRTHDMSSNEIVFFDASNLFYGDRIEPGTVVVEDLGLTGSADRMTFKLKDDLHGNLYRADSLSKHATWASVGNVLYEEGIIMIKSPHMPFFGKNAFRVSFSGEKHVYVLEMIIPAKTSLFNSSSNPTYQPLMPSDYANETAKEFVYFTGLTLHDNNLNVIGRANLAQPIIKREDDRIVIRLKMDF